MLNRFCIIILKFLVLIAVFFVRDIHSCTVSQVFYPYSNLPKEFQTTCEKLSSAKELGDIHLIMLDGFPDNSVVSFNETNAVFKRHKKRSNLKLKNGKALMVVSLLGYVPGLPITLAFEDSKNKFHEKITIIPNPLSTKSVKDGAKIEAILDCIGPTMYKISLTEFNKGEELLFQSTSSGEKIDVKFCPDETPTLFIIPDVIDELGGVGQVKFTRSSGEILELELSWGLDLLKYMMSYDENGEPQQMIKQESFKKMMMEEISQMESKRKHKLKASKRPFKKRKF